MRAAHAIGASLVLLPLPAMAGGGFGDMPLGFMLPFYSLLYAICAVAAAGLGFVMGSMWRTSTAVLALASLASALPTWVLATRGLDKAFEITTLTAFLMLIFGPPMAWGWRLGHRDRARARDLNRLSENGN